MKNKTLYPLADRPKMADLEILGLKPNKLLGQRVKAIYTGEKRPPRKGEWFLSGGIIEAYRASNDLNVPYHIAKLVKTKTVEVIDED